MPTSGLIAFAVLAATTFYAVFGARQNNDSRRFFSASGQFSLMFYSVLAIGDTYSLGTIFGFPGGFYADGGFSALWFCGYILMAFPAGTLIYPRLWQIARRYQAATLSDLLGQHFQSRKLDLMVAALLFMCFVPLGASQFVGLYSVLNAAGWPFTTPLGQSISVIALALCTFIVVSVHGLRGAARTSLIKDILVIGSILAVAIAIMLTVFARHQILSLPNMSETQHLSLAIYSPSLSGDAFILTTVLVQALAFCISPLALAAVISAKDVATIRRGQIVMPFYMALFPLLALVAVYGKTLNLASTRPDGIFLATAKSLLPHWMMGFVLAGVCLAAIVILAACGVALGGIVARIVVRRITPTQQIHVGWWTIAVFLGLSVIGAQFSHAMLISLNMLFFLGLSQVLPAILVIMTGWRVPASAIMWGITGGLMIGIAMRLSHLTPGGLNPSFYALSVNFCLCWLTRRSTLKATAQRD